MRNRVVYPYTENTSDSGDISDHWFTDHQPISSEGHADLFHSTGIDPWSDFNQWISNSGINFATWESKQETIGQEYVISLPRDPSNSLYIVYFKDYFLGDMSTATPEERLIAQAACRDQIRLGQKQKISQDEYQKLIRNDDFPCHYLTEKPLRDSNDQLRIDYMYCQLSHGQITFKEMPLTGFWSAGWSLPRQFTAKQLTRFGAMFGDAGQKDFASLFSARQYLTIKPGSIEAAQPLRHLSYVINHICTGTPTQRFVIRSPQDFKRYLERSHCAQRIFEYISPSQMFFSQFKQCFFDSEGGSRLRVSDYDDLLSYDSMSRRLTISIHHNKRIWTSAKISQDWLGVNGITNVNSLEEFQTDEHATVIRGAFVARISERSYELLTAIVGKLVDIIGVYRDLYIHEYKDVYHLFRVFTDKVNARQCLTKVIHHEDTKEITVNHGEMYDRLDQSQDPLMTRKVRRFRWWMRCRVNPWAALAEALHYPSRHSLLEISIQSYQRYHFYWWATIGLSLVACICWEVIASVNEWQMTTGVFQDMYLWQLGLIVSFALILLLVIKRQYDTRKITWSHYKKQPIKISDLAQLAKPRAVATMENTLSLVQQHKV